MAGCVNDKKEADLIISNARIYTVDEGFSVAEAMAVKDGKILRTGSTREILGKFTARKIDDLEGKCVYPGFTDAHCHFLGYAATLEEADLVGTSSFDEVIQVLLDHRKQHPGAWLLGRGWDQNDWAVKQWPHRHQLDSLFPGVPVLLKRIDGHAALVSGEAIKRAGISAATKVDGGEVLVQDGSPTGILIDNAMNLVEKLVPVPAHKNLVPEMLEAQKRCFAVGLTTLHVAGLPADRIDLIDSLQQSGQLKIRIYAMLAPGKKNFEAYMYGGIHKTDRLNVRSIKLYADGALGSRGALLLEPYADDPDHYGLQLSPASFFEKMCRDAYKHGFQVNTHCIGDSANRMILGIYAGILGGGNDLRWRIEHAQVVDPGDFDLFGRYNIIPSVQPTHATSDMYWAEERLGKERMQGAYAYKTLLDQNGWLPSGSDFPVEDINPLYGFYAAVSRKDRSGRPDEGFMPAQALSREEAMRAMTIWAAKAAFEEGEKGSLEKGKFADFVVTREDLMVIPEEDIPGVRILKTYLGGIKVCDAYRN